VKNNERQFFIYDVEAYSGKSGAQVPSMQTLAQVWSRHAVAGTAQHPIRNNSATLLIGDVVVDAANRIVTILVRISDTASPNSVYSDPSTALFQEHPKTGRTGGDVGAHVLVSLAPERGRPNIYTCAVERVPGLGSELVQRILNRVLRNQFSSDPTLFSYPHPLGAVDANQRPLRETSLPLLEFRGRPAQDFIDDINSGKLNGITLIREETATPVGGVPYLVKKESDIKIAVDHGNVPRNVWGGVQRAVRSMAATYPEAALHFMLPGEKRAVSVRINATTGAPLEELYIKSERLANITPFLADSAQQVVQHLNRRAKGIVRRERDV